MGIVIDLNGHGICPCCWQRTPRPTYHVQLQVERAHDGGHPHEHVKEEGEADVNEGAHCEGPQLGLGLPVRRLRCGLFFAHCRLIG